MRHLLLIAAFAAPAALADATPVRPEDADAPPGAAALSPLPPPFEPMLRGEGPNALRRSDVAAPTAPAPHGKHDHEPERSPR
jgi:hypothetical protein